MGYSAPGVVGDVVDLDVRDVGSEAVGHTAINSLGVRLPCNEENRTTLQAVLHLRVIEGHRLDLTAWLTCQSERYRVIVNHYTSVVTCTIARLAD